MPEFSEEALRKIAKEKVGKRLAIQIHVAAYIGVNLLLAVINLLPIFSGSVYLFPHHWWFLWPACSWAVGLVMHVASYLIWLAGVTSRSKKGLLYHMIAYITVNTYLIFVWWMSGSGYIWFLYPLFGWLVGLIIHSVTIRPKSGEMSWMDKKVEDELAKIKAKEMKEKSLKGV
ncbi:MAG: hypothetical protein RBG13Loki_0151 [Promethearchaeota archaeon CR_4]|nr:MAG: hypothetical protein RBG13Loki_0151 [Candidatus Lokiarchaeota archaeon CR_4]